MHACDQVLQALFILTHAFGTTSIVLRSLFFPVANGVMCCPNLSHIVHILGVHQQLFFILEDR